MPTTIIRFELKNIEEEEEDYWQLDTDIVSTCCQKMKEGTDQGSSFFTISDGKMALCVAPSTSGYHAIDNSIQQVNTQANYMQIDFCPFCGEHILVHDAS